MSNSPEKEKWWHYLILFLIGVLSLPLGLFSIVPLSGILTVLQNTLCDVGWCDIEIFWASQFLFPFLMCSILVSLVIYYFKKRSFALALKVLVISFAIISLLFFGGLSFLNFIQFPIDPFFIFLLILLIMFLIGLMAFKQHPLIGFAIRAFALSFAVSLLTIGAWVAISGAPTYYINVQRFDTVEEISATNPQLNKIESAVITAEELENYPVLKKAINEFDLTKNEYNSSWSKVERDEWVRTKDFIEQKGREPWYLFSIPDGEFEDDFNKSIFPAKLKSMFESRGYPISVNPAIVGAGTEWDIIEEQYLFNITDAELEKELEKINITMGDGEVKDIIPIRLKSAFDSNGYPVSENYGILRVPESWIILGGFDGNNYEIRKENEKLNVYTQQTKTYEIWNEEGKLNVYHSRGDTAFKFGEKYYKIIFPLGD